MIAAFALLIEGHRTVNICYILLIRHGNELALMDRHVALGFSTTTIAIAFISTVYCAANVYKAGKIYVISTRLVKFHPDDTNPGTEAIPIPND
jgi:hypothetical protein